MRLLIFPPPRRQCPLVVRPLNSALLRLFRRGKNQKAYSSVRSHGDQLVLSSPAQAGGRDMLLVGTHRLPPEPIPNPRRLQKLFAAGTGLSLPPVPLATPVVLPCALDLGRACEWTCVGC